MKVITPFISIGCNRHPSAADWRPTTTVPLLAYAARRSIALWNPEDPRRKGVRRVLKGHEETVNAVRWCSVPIYLGEHQPEEGGTEKNEDRKERNKVVGEEVILLSGGVDKKVGIWAQNAGRDGKEGEDVGFAYRLRQMVDVPGSVNDIAVLPGSFTCGTGRRGRLVAAASADGTVNLWEIWATLATSEQSPAISINHLQTLSTKPKFYPLTLTLSTLPNSHDQGIILAVAGSMTAIQIYVSGGEGERGFILRATLTGHENWVRSLEFTYERPEDQESDLLLASASQDKYIRLWRVHQGHELPPVQGKRTNSAFGLVGGSGLSNKAHRFKIPSPRAGEQEMEYSATFEALLMGHEDWIFTVRWRPSTGNGDDRLQLLSASADNSISIWQADEDSGIWLSTTRLGEISDQKGSSTATGSSGGLWIGLWSPSGSHVAALGRTGSWRLWKYSRDEDRWIQEVATGGHVREVTGISWSVGGKYLLSTSLDQTTRLYAPWTSKTGGGDGWHEFSRPQIHGYDINCIVALPAAESSEGLRRGGGRFVSGADEKLLRVFEEPKGVAGLLERFAEIGAGAGDGGDGGVCGGVENMPEGAAQPVLGLSNKAITSTTVPDNDDEVAGEDGTPTPAAPVVNQSTLLGTLAHPPLEDHLARHTLWPEAEKLYGHGYEISCVAAAHSGRYIATACRASSTEHAAIRIYETRAWREVKPPIVGGHELTVLSMDFSGDDRFLLSVGRDRQWVVYQHQPEGVEGELGGRYKEVARQPSKGGHTRVIWDGKWAPCLGKRSLEFATAGRDKAVRIWRQKKGDSAAVEVEFALVETIKFAEPVRALDYLPVTVRRGEREVYILAIGAESGDLQVYEGPVDVEVEGGVKPVVGGWKLVGKVPVEMAPGAAVSEVRWRMARGEVGESGKWDFAVASEDGSVRMYTVFL